MYLTETRRNEEEERTFVAESPHILRFWHDVIYESH